MLDTVRKKLRAELGWRRKFFHDKRKLFTGKMNLELKKRIVKCLIWSVATYTAETWTLKRSRQDEDRSLRDVDLEMAGEDQLER